jgi:amidophosphoribosyltransferase
MYAPTHKCGIGAVVNTRTPFQDMFRVAVSTQNRGYDGCGFSVFDLDNGEIRTYRRDGKVTDAFSDHVEAAEIRSDRGIFGTRYITAGDANPNNLQPIAAGGYVVAHNGNILNSRELAKEYGIHVEDPDSDTKVIAEIIRRAGTIEDGIRCLAGEAVGAFNLVVMDSKGLVGAYKDPWGYHPLFGGFKEDGNGRKSVYIASEEPGIYALEIYDTTEFKSGELWLIGGANVEKKSIKPAKTKERR